MSDRDAATPTTPRTSQPVVRQNLDGDARYAALVAALGQVVWRADTAGRVVDVTPPQGSLLDASGRPDWLHAVHAQDQSVVRHQWQEAVASGSPYTSICRMRLDGDDRWVRIQATPVRNSAGAVAEWIGVLVDIDDQRRTEERLRDSNDRRHRVLLACNDITQAGLVKREFVSRAIRHARELVDADYAGLGILAGDEIVCTMCDANGDAPPLRLHRSYSLSGQSLTSRMPFISNDLTREARCSPAATRQLDAKSLLLVPLEYKGRAVGLLLASASRVNAFTDADLNTLEQLGGTLAAAIANADAFEERDLLLSELTVAVEHVTKKEALFRALSEYSGELLHILDENGRFIYNSPSTPRILGYEPDELRGRSVLSLVHPDDLQAATAAFMELRSAPGNMDTIVVRMQHRDGSWRYVEGTCRNLLDVPAVSGIACNARDVTARINASRSIEFQAQLLQTVEQAVIAVDLQGDVMYWNNGATQIYGWTPAEVMGQRLRDFIVAPDMAERATEIDALLHQGQRWSGEFELQRRDSSKFTAYVTDTPIHDAAGKLIGFVGTSSDLTARRDLEKQLQQAQKMEAIGQLAGGVAHDFNNILTVITSYSEMLLEELGPGHMRDDLLEIRRAAYRAAELTGQLLAFSRKQVMRVEPLDLAAVVKSIEKMLRRVIHESIVFDAIYPAEPAMVLADRIQIEQVLMNLVVNARDAMPAGGRLRVSVELAAAQDAVILRVLDTGEGMSEAVRSRVFEPFFTTKGEGKGTGLGLAVVYGIIQQLGGSIDLVSAPGQGTDFRIELPLIADQPTDTESKEETARRGTETVMIVEDNESLAAIAARVLERFGYTVIAARSGVEACAIMERVPRPVIDLLVTDVVMPEMSGPELVKQLARAGVVPRVLYMSGYADPAQYAAELDAATEFLPKPWTPRDLAQAVRHALDRSPVAA